MILQPQRAESWKALEALLHEDIYVTVHLTLSRDTAASAMADLDRLAGLGVKALSVSFTDPGLRGTELVNRAASLGLELKYDLPVPYSADNPVARETADDARVDGAGNAWLYIEPDGDVLPAQGLAGQVLGNVLRDPWEHLYHS
jgi:MoaA/NifB/PqqE/SkfB family radical SAM enzyme